jgi:uncharacterized protein YjiS (DUF1127 family)
MSIFVPGRMTNRHASGLWAGVGGLLRLWRHRYRSRNELAVWSEHELHDLGMSRGDIASEIGKPFWKA